MKKIYASIDIGSDTVKIIVSEMYKNKMNVLATAKVPSLGIKKGLIIDPDAATDSVKRALAEVEGMLGIKIKDVLAIVPSYFLSLSKEKGFSTITNEAKEVKGNDIIRAMQASVYNKLPTSKELINIIPISFTLDDKSEITDPKGMVGDKLGVSVLMISGPKKSIHSIVHVIESAGVKVVDLIPTAITDFYELRDQNIAKNNGAIINIGSETTTVSVFNRGVLTGAETIQIGSKSIEKDLNYIYKLKTETSTKLKRFFALATPRNANSGETYQVEKLEINQYEISEVISARLKEILKLVKKQINLLTKEEISYIIFTGGATEIKDFKTLLDEVFDQATLGSIKTVGIRDNSFSVASGAIKYFYEKLRLRGKDYSMFTPDMERDFISSKKRILNFSEESVFGKVFGYFFEN